MCNYLLKTIFLLFCLSMNIALPCRTVAAQSEEEMKILRMFYREEELVISATRHPKPVSQVAENITVVTAKEIEEMNAHNVAEVLNRVPGLFVSFNQDFGASSLFYIQGSEARHVLILIDEIPWNSLASGAAETNSIPVGIIERIEIIKGPASSSWGSSLGGVINIITKQPGTTKRPTGSIRASYGEENTQDYRAEISGLAGSIGYYLFAGIQDSDGFRSSRDFDSYSLYSRFSLPVSRDVDLGVTIGYSQPDIGLGDFPSGDITSDGLNRNFFASASLDASINRNVSLRVRLHQFNQKSVQMNDALGLFMPAGTLFSDAIYDEETTGAGGRLVWEKGMHTLVLGVDFCDGDLDQTLKAGPFLQLFGAPGIFKTHPDRETWAIYVNDTIVIDRWSVIPGIRYDHDSITGSFVSPSLGITYKLGENTILRASGARGFTLPPLSWTSGGALFTDPNPSLDPEEVWSYQAGVESSAIEYLWVKATVFRHRQEDALKVDRFGGGPPAFNDIFVNNGKIRRRGIELEMETVPVWNLSFAGGFAYVHISPPNEAGADDVYSYDLAIKYDDGESFRMQLMGHYVWWDLDSSWNARYDTFIWDLSLNKRFFCKGKKACEIFLTGHNIFDGSQYFLGDNKNPGRWVEGGIRVEF